MLFIDVVQPVLSQKNQDKGQKRKSEKVQEKTKPENRKQ